MIDHPDKNSDSARTNRRFQATCQALRDAIEGAKQFETRTLDQEARIEAASVISQTIGELIPVMGKLIASGQNTKGN